MTVTTATITLGSIVTWCRWTVSKMAAMQSPARGVLSWKCRTAVVTSLVNTALSKDGWRLELNAIMFFATLAPSQLMIAWKNSASEA